MSLSLILFRSLSAISNARMLQSLISSGRTAREPSQLMETVRRKSLGTFFGFRCSLITTANGVPIDFGITAADRDGRDVLPLLAERGTYPILLGDKGYISQHLQAELMETEATVLLPTLRRNQKQQYPEEVSQTSGADAPTH